ncbi:MAG: AMP-binding protein [Alphaproteobacteria bacterium]|nr:AMP-binding protein [Alphaproteobacteria bacterium]
MSSAPFNFGAAYEKLAAALPEDAPALLHDDTVITFREWDQQASALADTLSAAGLERGAHVGHYLRNSPAYLQAFYGCAKAGLTHVNVNYRYKADELAYLFDNLDIEAVVYDRDFAGEVAKLKELCPKLKAFIEVGPGKAENSFATPLHEAMAGEAKPGSYSADDQIIIATGGTTGMPKGVMWRHEDMWGALNVGGQFTLAPENPEQPARDLDEHIENTLKYSARARFCPLNPLMHGAGLMTALFTLAQGGSILTVGGEKFDALTALRQVKKHKVQFLGIVGDAFCYPMAEALDAHPDEQLMDTVAAIASSGAIWTKRNKERLLEHNPKMVLIDSLGSSESAGFGASISGGGADPQTAKFMTMPRTKVLDVDNDFAEIKPGSGEMGMLAVGGSVPLGYYGDEKRTKATFPTIDGQRYVLTGDMCTVEDDGSITFHGRGSYCINTGGEKVFVEEVEEALKSLPQIADALVVGLPHERFGQMVVAVVEPSSGEVDQEALRAELKSQISDYKVPKHVISTTEVPRAPNGKADYPGAKKIAEAALGIQA